MECKTTITFNVLYKGEATPVQTYNDEFGSLLDLISAYFEVRGFGICYGGGSCGTCGVRILGKSSGKKSFVLSCETAINEGLSNKDVVILRN